MARGGSRQLMKRRVVLLTLSLCLAPLPLVGQSVDSDVAGATNACFGFSFGRWDPPLDWGKAGHEGPPRQAGPDAGAAQDGGRRQWAADQTERGKVEMVLFPAWWPVGVHVQLAEAGGDTLRGTATALVADGRMRAPVAKVAALRVPCGGSGPRPPVKVEDDPLAADGARAAAPAAKARSARRPAAPRARTP